MTTTPEEAAYDAGSRRMSAEAELHCCMVMMDGDIRRACNLLLREIVPPPQQLVEELRRLTEQCYAAREQPYGGASSVALVRSFAQGVRAVQDACAQLHLRRDAPQFYKRWCAALAFMPDDDAPAAAAAAVTQQ